MSSGKRDENNKETKVTENIIHLKTEYFVFKFRIVTTHKMKLFIKYVVTYILQKRFINKFSKTVGKSSVVTQNWKMSLFNQNIQTA